MVVKFVVVHSDERDIVCSSFNTYLVESVLIFDVVHLSLCVFFLFYLVSSLKRPITPPATLGMLEYQNADHEHLMKRLRPAQSVEEVIVNSFYFLNSIQHLSLTACIVLLSYL